MCFLYAYFLSVSTIIVPHILNSTIKTALNLPVSTVSAQLISTFIFFLLKVEFNFSVQRFFAFAYKFNVYVTLLIRQKKKIRIKSFFK